MADIATIWDVANGRGDWALDSPQQLIWVDQNGNSIVDEDGLAVDSQFTAGNGILSGSDLQTAVLISIFTDAEAGPDDIIPDGSGDPRGWCGGPIGSKLWLRARSKATATLPALIQNDLETALAWMVSDGICASVDAAVSYFSASRIDAVIVLRRQDGTQAALQFSNLWESV